MEWLQDIRRKCPQCGRVFRMTVSVMEWGYTFRKTGNGNPVPLCSYSCMRAHERPKEESHRERMRKEFERARHAEERAKRKDAAND